MSEIYAQGGDFFHYIAHYSCRLHLEFSFTILLLFMQWLYLRSIRLAPVPYLDEKDHGISLKFFLGLLAAWGLYLFASLIIRGGHLFKELATTGFPYAFVYVLLNLAIGSLMIVVGARHLRLKFVNTQRVTNWIRTWGVRLTERLLIAELVCGALVLDYAYTYVYLLKYGFPVVGAIGSILAVGWLILAKSRNQSRWRRPRWALGTLIVYFGLFCLLIGLFNLFRPESATIKLRHILYALSFLAVGWLISRDVRRKDSSRWEARRSWLLLAVSIAAIGLSIWYRLQCIADVERLRVEFQDALGHVKKVRSDLAGYIKTAGLVRLTAHDEELAEYPPRQHIVRLNEKGVFMDCVRMFSRESDCIVTSSEELAKNLQSMESGYRELHPGQDYSRILNLVVDARTKWGTIADFSAMALKNNYGRIFFAFQKEEKPRGFEKRCFLADEYREVCRKHSEIAEECIILPAFFLLRVCDHCFRVLETCLGGSCYADTAEVTYLTLRDFPDALDSCNCLADMEAVTFLLWEIVSYSWYLSVRVDITNETEEGVADVALDADMPWSEARRYVLDAAKKTRRMHFVTTSR